MIKKRNDTDAILFDFMGVLMFKRADYQPDQLVDDIDRIIGKSTDDQKFKEDIHKQFQLPEERLQEILEVIVGKYEPFPALWDLLPDLKTQYKLAIVNNGISLTLPRWYVKYGIVKQFDLFVSSAVEGIAKPDPEIYLRTASRLGVDPQRCLFMDDVRQNVEGAGAVGMQGIWWETREKGFQEFKGFLIKAS